MMENFPSPGASCGSPYSDVTSGSPGQYSDSFEPVSPDYTIDNLRAEFSVQATPSSDSVAEYSVHEDKSAIADYIFYQNLPVGTPDGVHSHLQHLINKYEAGALGLPSRTAPSDSLTPYSDIAQPKKPGKEGTIKRPMNAFMVFAKTERRHLMAGQPELHNARISKHLGDVWKQCPLAVQDPYKQLAEWLKELHRQEHPEYKYRPRKRKTSGSTAAAPAASVYASGPKAAKSARKTAKRSRARKPTGQNHVVPASSLAEVAPAADYNEQLYSDINPVMDDHHVTADVKPTLDDCHFPADVKPVLHEQHARAEPDFTGATGDRLPALQKDDLGRDDLGDNGLEDLAFFDEQGMLAPIVPMAGLLDFSDAYGFELSSEDLVQGHQVHDALDFHGEVDNILDYAPGLA